MEVVHEVLVIGVGVHGLHVAVVDAVVVLDDLEHRGDAVGGAGGRRDDRVLGRDVVRVHAEHDVLHLALARGRQQDLRGALGLQVLGQALVVAPASGVVDDQRVLDAVGGVVHRGRVVRVDDLDLGAVGGDHVAVLVHHDRPVERAVDRVAAQQGGALDQVVLRVLAHDDGTQAQLGATAGVVEEDAGQQAADATEAVEHDVLGLAQALTGLALDLGELGVQEGLDVLARGLVLGGQLGQVDGGGAQVHRSHGLDQGVGGLDAQRGLLHAAGVTVGLDDVDHAAVHEGAPVDRGDHVVLAVQGAQQGDHLLRELLLRVPLGGLGRGGVCHGSPSLKPGGAVLGRPHPPTSLSADSAILGEDTSGAALRSRRGVHWSVGTDRRTAACPCGGARKVRAPQSRMVDNIHPGRPAGQCHREKTASAPCARR